MAPREQKTSAHGTEITRKLLGEMAMPPHLQTPDWAVCNNVTDNWTSNDMHIQSNVYVLARVVK